MVILVGSQPSAVKDITTSVCSDGKNVRSDSQWQPFSQMIPHGQGQVHIGTPRTPNSTIGANGLYKFEAKYDLSTESPLHSWGPKLAARYFNMNINNGYKLVQA